MKATQNRKPRRQANDGKPRTVKVGRLTVVDAIPEFPVYTVSGTTRSPDFSRGIHGAIDVLRMANGEPGDESYNRAAERMLERISMLMRVRGDYAEGVVAALCAHIAMHEQVGSPNLDLFTPFSKPFLGDDGEIPPEGYEFFDVDGAPYSVGPNFDTDEWSDETTRAARHIDSIRGRAIPISRAKFEEMRWRIGSAQRRTEEGARNG
jgi:hypothetical protein